MTDSTFFLTNAELQQASGLRRPAPITGWLIQNGIPYLTAAKASDKWPRVCRAWIRDRAPNTAKPQTEPDFTGLFKR